MKGSHAVPPLNMMLYFYGGYCQSISIFPTVFGDPNILLSKNLIIHHEPVFLIPWSSQPVSQWTIIHCTWRLMIFRIIRRLCNGLLPIGHVIICSLRIRCQTIPPTIQTFNFSHIIHFHFLTNIRSTRIQPNFIIFIKCYYSHTIIHIPLFIY